MIPPSSYMGAAFITKVLCFLPVDIIIVVITVMAVVLGKREEIVSAELTFNINFAHNSYLHITSFVVSNKGIAIVNVVHNGYRQTCIVTLAIDSLTK